jgi:ferredoxin
MKKITPVLIALLLCGILALQILALTGILPHLANNKVCPVDAISMQSGKAVIDAERCIGCQRCVLGIKLPISAPVPVPDTLEAVVPNPPPVPAAVPEQPKQQVTTEVAVKETPPPAKKSHKVDPSVCIGCQLCVQPCPVNAISIVDGKAVIDPEKCINCGICVKGDGLEFNGCPVSAISFK